MLPKNALPTKKVSKRKVKLPARHSSVHIHPASSPAVLRDLPLSIPSHIRPSIPRDGSPGPLPQRQLRTSNNVSAGSIILVRHSASPGPLRRQWQRRRRHILDRHYTQCSTRVATRTMRSSFLRSHVRLIASVISSVELDTRACFLPLTSWTAFEAPIHTRSVDSSILNIYSLSSISPISSSSISSTSISSAVPRKRSECFWYLNSSLLSSSYYASRPSRLRSRLTNLHL